MIKYQQMDSPLEEIKRKIDIVEYIGGFVQLKKAGRNFKGLCPFHQEKTPSFIVSPERQIWHCFGACGEGGDIFRFLMKWENLTFYESVRELAKKAGVRLTRITYEDAIWKQKEKIIAINTVSSQYYHYLLMNTKFGKKARDYLEKRAIKKSIIEKFQIGYAPLSWESLVKFLRRKNYALTDIMTAGLIIKGDQGSYYDRFRGRIIFPIKNARGEITGFSGRLINSEDKEAKYINTPETPLYHKRESLFGIDLAKEAIRREGNVYLVEGEFDMITPYQAGVTNIVAVKGTAVTREQLLVLKRYTAKVSLLLDTDQAGEEAIRRSIDMIEELEIEGAVIKIDFAKDPDEAVRIDWPRFKQSLRSPLPVYDFLLEFFQKKYPLKDPFNKKRVGEAMAEYLERMRNPIIKEHYQKKLAALLDVSERSIETLIRRIKYREKRRAIFRMPTKEGQEKDRQSTVEKYLLSVILQGDNIADDLNKVDEIITQSDFYLPAIGKLYVLLRQYIKENNSKEFSLTDFGNSLPSQLRPLLDEVFLFATHFAERQVEDVKKIALSIKRYSLKRQISTILSSENKGTKEKKQLVDLTKQLNQVEKKLTIL